MNKIASIISIILLILVAVFGSLWILGVVDFAKSLDAIWRAGAVFLLVAVVAMLISMINKSAK